MGDRPVTWPPPGTLAITAHMIDTLPEYGNDPRATARDPYLRARWADMHDHDRRAALATLAHAARPLEHPWHAGGRYARRLQRHAARHQDADPLWLRENMPAPPSLRTGLTAALTLVTAATPEPHTPPRTHPHPATYWPQLLNLAVLGALIVALARAITPQ